MEGEEKFVVRAERPAVAGVPTLVVLRLPGHPVSAPRPRARHLRGARR